MDSPRFIEVTIPRSVTIDGQINNYDEKWAVNVNAVSFITPHAYDTPGGNVRVYFIGDKLPLEVKETYDELMQLIYPDSFKINGKTIYQGGL